MMTHWIMTRLIAGLLAAALLCAGSAEAQKGPRYTRIHRLTPREGVFAYARISPDGKRLVYASNIPRGPGESQWIETVVELSSGKTLWSGGGIDAWWSPDGTRIIYAGDGGVVVRNIETGETVPNPEAGRLGDYYSWAERDGKDLILTIQSNYYYLDRGRAVLPHTKVSSCSATNGSGERPLISRDGRRITTFVKGNVTVRGLDNCDDVLNTGIQGGKADFSWDGRYIAFHAIKGDGSGYDIRIVDLREKTVRTMAFTGASILFPSWTKDGRLCFRYDGPDYRGFMMASAALDLPAAPMATASSPSLPERRTWQDIFPETPAKPGTQLVLIWAPWSAHSQIAFDALRRLRDASHVGVNAAADPTSATSDIQRQLADFHVTIPSLPLSAKGLELTEARNQMPTILLFRDGVLVDRRLGAQSFEDLRAWVSPAEPHVRESFQGSAVSRGMLSMSQRGPVFRLVPPGLSTKAAIIYIAVASLVMLAIIVAKWD
jgi:hypothetical protein